MKKKITAIALSFFLVGSAVLANNFKANFNGFHFIAPAVNGKANVYQPEIGEIVYDSSDAKFWGYDQTGTWINLGTTGGSGTPTGSLLPFAGATAPTGYLIADGSAVSRSAYSTLFAVIGTTYGVGDGSTTFNLPDTRNVFLRGANNSTRTIGTVNYPQVVLGTTSNDKFQGHWHVSRTNSASGGANSLSNMPAAGFNGTIWNTLNTSSQQFGVGDPVADASNVTPRTGLETAPVNLGVNFIIKY